MDEGEIILMTKYIDPNDSPQSVHLYVVRIQNTAGDSDSGAEPDRDGRANQPEGNRINGRRSAAARRKSNYIDVAFVVVVGRTRARRATI